MSGNVDWNKWIEEQSAIDLKDELRKPISKRKPVKVLRTVPDYDTVKSTDTSLTSLGGGCYMKRNLSSK